MIKGLTVLIEKDDAFFVAYCPEVPGANGQGNSKEEAIKNLSESIELIFEDRRKDSLKGAPADVIKETLVFA